MSNLKKEISNMTVLNAGNINTFDSKKIIELDDVAENDGNVLPENSQIKITPLEITSKIEEISPFSIVRWQPATFNAPRSVLGVSSKDRLKTLTIFDFDETINKGSGKVMDVFQPEFLYYMEGNKKIDIRQHVSSIIGDKAGFNLRILCRLVGEERIKPEVLFAMFKHFLQDKEQILDGIKNMAEEARGKENVEFVEEIFKLINERFDFLQKSIESNVKITANHALDLLHEACFKIDSYTVLLTAPIKKSFLDALGNPYWNPIINTLREKPHFDFEMSTMLKYFSYILIDNEGQIEPLGDERTKKYSDLFKNLVSHYSFASTNEFPKDESDTRIEKIIQNDKTLELASYDAVAIVGDSTSLESDFGNAAYYAQKHGHEKSCYFVFACDKYWSSKNKVDTKALKRAVLDMMLKIQENFPNVQCNLALTRELDDKSINAAMENSVSFNNIASLSREDIETASKSAVDNMTVGHTVGLKSVLSFVKNNKNIIGSSSSSSVSLPGQIAVVANGSIANDMSKSASELDNNRLAETFGDIGKITSELGQQTPNIDDSPVK
ncbi:MAG: hypothetical protein LBB09_02515 [Rickettsiales bacterium]|jgi:predicted transcriptional regulator|nr:hypothetical protein [Rickettsiales bacterium]